MPSILKRCSIEQCSIYSSSRCHCCNEDLCDIHLEQHVDRSKSSATSFADEINSLLTYLNRIASQSNAIIESIEKWRVQAHETVDKFCLRLRSELVEEKIISLDIKMHQFKDTIDQLIEQENAMRGNVDGLQMKINEFRQQLAAFYKISESIPPLVINEKDILKGKLTKTSMNKDENNDLAALRQGLAIQIFLLWNSSTHLVTIRKSDTILNVKRRIEKKLGYSVASQRLIRNGRVLEDDLSISDYAIGGLCIVYLALRSDTRAPTCDKPAIVKPSGCCERSLFSKLFS